MRPPGERGGYQVPRDVTVLLVDDHTLVRAGLRLVLESQTGIRVMGEAEDGRQAIDMVEQLHPDVVVMDIAMPHLNGLDATRRIRRRSPTVKVVILTMHESQQYLLQIVKAGAIGCVLKRSAENELAMAVHAAARGESYFSPVIAGVMLEDYRMRIGPETGDRMDLLTEREREVLQLVAEGHSNQEVAEYLAISLETVKVHRAHLREKLDAHDRGDLVKHAIRAGLIAPE
jgi:DNA-binding NarL/FixJ family response regulator